MNGAILALRPARRGDALALHAQISDQIRAAIGGGALHPGDQLPPEAELAKQAHVARLTVRQALDNLQREGMIERRHGIGTFVAEQAARNEHLAQTAYSHAEEANIAAAKVKAEAVKLRLEAKRLRAEMVELRRQLALLLAEGAPRRGAGTPLPTTRRRAHPPLSHAARASSRPRRANQRGDTSAAD